MPSKRNTDQSLYSGTNPGTQYLYMHGPFENFGIFNGQFEQGPSGQDETDPPEGWLYTVLGAGGTFTRVTGGYAGNWCARGGQAGTGQGVTLISQKYIPVSEYYVYYFQVAACHTNNGTIRPGIYCYNAAKAALATVYPVAAFIPATVYGVAWTLYYWIIAPGIVALSAGTRYVRPMIELQLNAALLGAYAYADDVKFQQIQRQLWPQ